MVTVNVTVLMLREEKSNLLQLLQMSHDSNDHKHDQCSIEEICMKVKKVCVAES